MRAANVGKTKPGRWAMRKPEAIGLGGGVRGYLGAVRLRRAVPDEDPVEAGVLVGPSEAPQVVAVDDRTAGAPSLGLVPCADHADEFDGHC